MKVLDPGHTYLLDALDDSTAQHHQILQFVKRVGKNYPGNNAPAYPGVTGQEVLRALINRFEYTNKQLACAETQAVIQLLKTCILLLEVRAKRVHGEKGLDLANLQEIQSLFACPECGHIRCTGVHNHAHSPADKDGQ